MTAGVVSVPPEEAPPAVGHAYVSEVALAASSVASSSVDDLEVLRDRIDRALRTGLFIVLSPVVVPIYYLGLVQGFSCVLGGCEPQLLFLATQLANFFQPPASTPVDSTESERWDRVDRAIRTGLLVVLSPVVVPVFVVARLGISAIAPYSSFWLDRGLAGFRNTLVSVNNALVDFFFPPPPPPPAAFAVARRELSSAALDLGERELEAGAAGSPRVQPTAVRAAAKRPAKLASQAGPKKATAEKAAAPSNSDPRNHGRSARASR
ncbi:hypothetical protein ACTXG7_27225 [Mycolicibacterium sp. Dal123E01]|uniref:hypothetical protein n=1 Tax=Mycolicibacterium sp. Dal123E01 TaxID=3457578 RepID=UPI00403E9D28